MWGGGEIEYHHLRTLVAGYLYTMLVGVPYQKVVGINKLQVLSCSHLETLVSGFARSCMTLANVGNLIVILHQLVYGTLSRAIVDNDNLAFAGRESQCQNAVDTLTKHVGREVVIGYDKTD
jgi:hypothetical protein